ncbi:MAG: VOC family protein [Pseudomonadota bacterium]
MELDHLVVSGTTLGPASDWVAQTLGVTMQPGGEHPDFATHNTLLGLEDGLYLEVISGNPEAPYPGRPKMYDLDHFSGPPRLTNWACRTDDMAASLSRLPSGTGEVMAVSRGDLRWQMAVPVSGQLPYDNYAPALLHWEGDLHPIQRLKPSGCRLISLTVCHPEAAALEASVADLMHDPRIVFETGPAGLSAQFETPKGPVTLA